jgi:hypothetical protein
MLDLSGVDQLPDAARGDVLGERDPPHVETEYFEQVEIALAAASEAERLPCGDRLRADAAEHSLGELLSGQRRKLLVKGQHERVLDARVGQQLESALERGE